MIWIWFLGAPSITSRGGRPWTESPITPDSLPINCFQTTRYNATRSEILAEITCPDAGAAEEARTVALATAGITSEISEAEAEALIESGQFK